MADSGFSYSGWAGRSDTPKSWSLIWDANARALVGEAQVPWRYRRGTLEWVFDSLSVSVLGSLRGEPMRGRETVYARFSSADANTEQVRASQLIHRAMISILLAGRGEGREVVCR